MATLKDSSKINLRTVLFLVCVTLIAFNPCALAHTDVTAEHARDLISSMNNLVVVDVREPYEYCDAIGHIPGALNYPLSSGVLEARYEKLPIDKPILVVCQSGGRSNVAANFLDSKGFSMVYDMLRGMSAWAWETEPCKDDSDSETADSAEINTYVFLSDQSTVVQTGGIAGVHETYPIEGQFQLKVNVDDEVAGFGYVDAFLLSPVSSSPPQSLGELFNMAILVGEVLDDMTISFTGKADDGSDVLITVTIENDLAYLVGETIPPLNSADFFLFSLDAVAQRKYGGGTGDPNNPYKIATAEDLMLLGETPEDYDKHFIMIDDIDLDPNLPGCKVFEKAVIAPDTDPNEWWNTFEGIPFNGIFNGDGHKISHLTIKGNDYVGLFGRLEAGAEVRNLGMLDVNIISGRYRIGGLVGENEYGTVTDCYSTGVVSGGWGVGGLVGENYYGEVTGCYSIGIVNGTGNGIGGLVGSNDTGIITTSYSNGLISGGSSVGGLVGENFDYSYFQPQEFGSGNITTSYSTATVRGTGRGVGGLVGSSSGRINTSYSTGKVTGGSGVGGLVGGHAGTLTQCYSTGLISGDWGVGGLVGRKGLGSVVSGCFWDTQTSSFTRISWGTGLTTAEMQTAGTFLEAGWDFVGETENGTEDIWWIDEGQGYPRLWWELVSEN